VKWKDTVTQNKAHVCNAQGQGWRLYSGDDDWEGCLYEGLGTLLYR